MKTKEATTNERTDELKRYALGVVSERDALLEACKELLSAHTNADAYETACEKARKVIANVEKGEA